MPKQNCNCQKLANYEKSENLANYVRLKYRNQLSNGALLFYLTALPYLEEQRCGLCQPITANYDQLAKAGLRAVRRLKPVLTELSGVLCEVETGIPISGGKKATRIRRYSIKELKNGKPSRKLVKTTPDAGNRLAEALTARSFMYGDSQCHSEWNTLKTGRVQSRDPNVQGDSEKVRIENLKAGLEPGTVLFSLDYKAAEPSIIQQLLDYTFPEPPYETLAALEGISRADAKGKVNTLAYANSAQKIIQYWQEDAKNFFADYAAKLDAYKQKLWQSGKPKGKIRRHVHTVGGSFVMADKGERVHAGKVMNWHVQGTVADITNSASLDVISREDTKNWKLCFPVHDALYVIGQPDDQPELEAIMQDHATRLKLELTVKTQKVTGIEHQSSRKDTLSLGKNSEIGRLPFANVNPSTSDQAIACG